MNPKSSKAKKASGDLPVDPRLKKAASYTRAPESRGKDVPYEQKFAGLIKLCKKAKAEGFGNVVVSWPWVIGDNYEEITESLSRFSDAGLAVHIVGRWTGDSPPPQIGLN